MKSHLIPMLLSDEERTLQEGRIAGINNQPARIATPGTQQDIPHTALLAWLLLRVGVWPCIFYHLLAPSSLSERVSIILGVS